MANDAYTALAGAAVATILLNRLQDQHTLRSYVTLFASLATLELVCYLLYAHVVYPFLLSPLRNLPGPGRGHWLLGHGPAVFQQRSRITLIRWLSEIPNDGLIRYLTYFNLERVAVTKPQALAEVLVNKSYDFKKPRMMRSALIRLLGEGLVVSEGDVHRLQRRHLQPAFAFRHIKELYPMFWRNACHLVDLMRADLSHTLGPDGKEGSPEGEFEMSPLLNRLTLDIIGQAACGLKFGALDDPDNKFARAFRDMISFAGGARFLAVLAFLIPARYLNMIPTTANKKIAAGRETIRRECIRLIQDKKRLMADKQESGVDILGVAMQSNVFSDDELIDHLTTILFAGHETTANACAWALYFLATYPDVQDRLRAEIRAHVPSPETEAGRAAVDHTTIDGLPYLRAFCSEVLRFTPPVQATVREVAGDNTVVAGTRLPKGTVVLIPISAIQWNADLWGPDVDKFRPDRWLGEKNVGLGGAVNNLAFATFLHGPRSCIAQPMARAEFACIVAAAVGSLEWDMKDQKLKDWDAIQSTLQQGIVARFGSNLQMKARRVEGW